MTAHLDIENCESLTRYLQARGLLPAGQALAEYAVLAGGVSNKTVYVALDSGASWVIKQCLAKLRVQVDWFTSPERIHREAEALRVLPDLIGPGRTPGLIDSDREAHVLVMQAVPQPHRNWKHMLLAGELHDDHVRQFGAMLAALHSASAARLADYEMPFADRSFYEALRLEAYYGFAAQQAPGAAAFYDSLLAETRAQYLSLVHADYSPKNVLVRGDQLILLDHETMHIGDPAFDIGFSMTHLLSKAHHVVGSRAGFAQAARLHWATYQQHSTADFARTPAYEARAVRHVLGCLLARVDGRSPLEYLRTEERDRQRRVVLALMAQPPVRIDDLITRFIRALES